MEEKKTVTDEGKSKRTLGRSIVAGLFGLLAAIYLTNPGAGILEIIPDNIPVIGNLDEAAATMLLISCLAYFGVDLGGFFGRKPKKSDIIDVEVDEP